MAVSRFAFVVIVVVLLVVGVGVGVLLGYFVRPQTPQESLMDKLTVEADPTISKKLMDEINADNIKDYLRYVPVDNIYVSYV